jgi:hypothetical protein
VGLKNEQLPPRAFSDYEISLDAQMPDGVEVIERL